MSKVDKSNQTSSMLLALRGLLKSAGITHEELAKKMKLSSDTIKRLLGGKIPITLERISLICEILEIDVYELARISKFGMKPQAAFLSIEQEKILASNDQLFVVFYLAVMGITVEEIAKTYKFTKEEVLKIILKLENLGILELHAKNKLKMKVYRKVRWNMDGPLHNKYMVAMAQDFAADVYQSHDSFKFFFNCPLSQESREIVLMKMKELCREVEHMSEMDLNLRNSAESSVNIFIGAKKWMPEVHRKFMR